MGEDERQKHCRDRENIQESARVTVRLPAGYGYATAVLFYCFGNQVKTVGLMRVTAIRFPGRELRRQFGTLLVQGETEDPTVFLRPETEDLHAKQDSWRDLTNSESAVSRRHR